jgi:hypothetical protein
MHNNLGMDDKAAKSYLDSNFGSIWNRFDVNDEGKIEIDRMP